MTHENSSGIAHTCLTTTTHIAPSITQMLYKLAQEHWTSQPVSEKRELAVPKFSISSLKYFRPDTQLISVFKKYKVPGITVQEISSWPKCLQVNRSIRVIFT